MLYAFFWVIPRRLKFQMTGNHPKESILHDSSSLQVLTNIHDTPAEGNVCDESGNTLKPAIVEDYNRHTGYIDKSDRMANGHYWSLYMEMDVETVLSSPRPQNSQQPHSPEVLRF